MKTMVDLSHDFLKPILHRQAIVLDLTVGNGKDTAFFLKKKGCKVYGFEIQKEAADKANERFKDQSAIIYPVNHALLKETLDPALFENIDGAIANFGYLPGSTSEIETKPQDSLTAVQDALTFLKEKGRMSLVFYDHHDAAKEEALIQEYLLSLNPHQFAIQKIVQFNANKAPFLICIEKKKHHSKKM